MARRCALCGTAKQIRPATEPDHCPTCRLFDNARDAIEHAEQLREIAGASTWPNDEASKHARSAMIAGAGALDTHAANLEHVAKVVRRQLEPHRRRRDPAPA